MGKKTDKVKKHFSDNKKLYIGVGIGVAVTVIVLRFTQTENGAQVVQKINQIAWRPENNQMVVKMVERSTPSKPVHLVGTNLFFSSLNEASRETGHTLSAISKNVNGLIPDVKGDVFQLLEPAA